MVLIPNLLETIPNSFAAHAFDILDNQNPSLNKIGILKFLTENIKELGNPDHSLIDDLKKKLEEYVEAACIKAFVLGIKKLEKIESIDKLDNTTLSDLVILALKEVLNFIDPLNRALVDYNSRRIFSRIGHISELPTENTFRALTSFAVSRKCVDPQGNLVQEAAASASLHESLIDQGSAELNKKQVKHKLINPLAAGIIQFFDLNNPEISIPLPSAFEGKVWNEILDNGVPKFVEWLMLKLHNNSTKTGIVHALVSKFEEDMKALANARKNNAPNITSNHRSGPPLSPQNRAILRSCVQGVLKLAPQNLLVVAYKYFPDIKEGIDGVLEEALTEFLAKFTLIDLMDIFVTGLAYSLHSGKWDENSEEYLPLEGDKNFKFTFPRNPMEEAIAKAIRENEDFNADVRTREKLLIIVKNGIQFYREKQLYELLDSIGDFFNFIFKDRCCGLGNVVLTILKFLYETIIKEFGGWLFGKPLKWLAWFFDWLFTLYITRDVEPQLNIFKMPVFESFVNNFLVRAVEVLNAAELRGEAQKANAVMDGGKGRTSRPIL